MSDPFYDVRNALLVGNYHQAVAEAGGAKTTLRKADDVMAFNAEKEALLALAQIGLGHAAAVVTQLSSATHPTLQAVRRWAEFCSAAGGPSSGEALTALAAAAEDVSASRVQVAVLAARALLASDDCAGALKLCKKWLNELPSTEGTPNPRLCMELRAVVVEALLRLRRPDLARGEVKAMEQLDDESAVTVLCSGVVGLHEGVKSREAYHSALQRFKELSMRCGQSVLALNLTALAHMGLDDFATAERTLLDALAMKSGDADTTANLAVVSAYLCKAADPTNRYIQQAATVTGAWSCQYAAMSSRLDEAVREFKVNS